MKEELKLITASEEFFHRSEQRGTRLRRSDREVDPLESFEDQDIAEMSSD